MHWQGHMSLFISSNCRSAVAVDATSYKSTYFWSHWSENPVEPKRGVSAYVLKSDSRMFWSLIHDAFTARQGIGFLFKYMLPAGLTRGVGNGGKAGSAFGLQSYPLLQAASDIWISLSHRYCDGFRVGLMRGVGLLTTFYPQTTLSFILKVKSLVRKRESLLVDY